MFGSQTLDVVLGMAFLFALLSLLTSAARELIETRMKSRAKELEKGIGELLGGKAAGELKKWLYEHPSVASLYQSTFDKAKGRPVGGIKLPAYIPARNFAEALLDLAARGPMAAAAVAASPGAVERNAKAVLTGMGLVTVKDRDAAVAAATKAAEDKAAAAAAGNPPANPVTTVIDVKAIRTGIDTHLAGHPCIRRSLLVALDNATTLDEARKNVEAWYDSAMDRVSAWYKRRTQYWLIIIGFAGAAVLNIDSIHIVNTLASNDTLRKAVVAEAELHGKARAAEAVPDRRPPAQTTPAMTSKKAPADGAAAAAAKPDGANDKRTAAAPPTDAADASPAASSDDGKVAEARFTTLKSQIETLGLPIGWQDLLSERAHCLRTAASDSAAKACAAKSQAITFDPADTLDQIEAGFWQGIIGWLVTAFAISFGAPFWFDVLNRVMVIRSTVKPGEKSGNKPAKN